MDSLSLDYMGSFKVILGDTARACLKHKHTGGTVKRGGREEETKAAVLLGKVSFSHHTSQEFGSSGLWDLAGPYLSPSRSFLHFK